MLVLSLASFFLTFVLFTTRENEKEKRLIVDEKNALLLSHNEELNAKIKEYQDNEKKFNAQISKIIEEKASLSEKLEVCEKERQNALDNISGLQIKLENGKKEFAEYKKKTGEIVNDFKKQNEKLLNQVENLRSTVSGEGMVAMSVVDSASTVPVIAAQIPTATAKRADQLPKVVVTPPNVKTGKVIVVNRKYNFFICNLGKEDGLALNDKVAVFQNNQLIATGVVEKVYDNLSANGIQKEKKVLRLAKVML